MRQIDWRALFGLDVRSLGAFRIGLGLITLFDFANHAPWLGAFYTDRGILPRPEVQAQLGGLWPPQMWSGGLPWQVALWGVGVVAAVLFTLGWRARAAAAVAALVVLTFIQRNMMIVFGGDSLLYYCLLWSAFLPTDRCFSLAARRAPKPAVAPDPWVVSPGSAALMLQVVFLYAMTCISKLQYPAWWDGRAVYMVLSKATLATQLGDGLRSFPRVLAVATVATPFAEGLLAVLFLAPHRKGKLRTAGVFLNAFFQLSLWLCLQIGIFQALSLVAGIVFLPSAFWERLGIGTGKVVALDDPQPVVSRRERLSQGLCAVLLGVMVLQNLLAIPKLPVQAPGALGAALSHPAIAQRWRMFANVEVTPQGWWLAPGRLTDGRLVDLWTGQPLTYARPTSFVDVIRSHQWERTWSTLYAQDNIGVRPYLAAYLCREWNRQHGAAEQVREIKLIHMREIARDPRVPVRVEMDTLLVARCAARVR